MRTSVNTNAFEKMQDIQLILKLLKKAGFEAYDYTMFSGDYDKCNVIHYDDYIGRAHNLKEYADTIGIKCVQSHAPFPSWKKGDEEYNARLLKMIARSIEVTGILGGKICVVHPNNNATPEENAEFYNKLLPYAKKHNVKIGVENMWNWKDDKVCPAACSDPENYSAHLELLDKEWFVANLDIGHAEMEGVHTSSVDMIHKLDTRLDGLHIHDNDKIDDLHQCPYTNKVDFAAIIEALRDVSYKGDVNLEVFAPASLPLDLYYDHMVFLCSVANYIKAAINK